MFKNNIPFTYHENQVSLKKRKYYEFNGLYNWSYFRNRKSHCRIFGTTNYRLILCGRKKDQLQNLEKSLGKQTDVITLQFDVRNKNDVFNSIETYPKVLEILMY